MLWGPTAFEVPHRPRKIGQSGWNESLPAGRMQVQILCEDIPASTLKRHGFAICLSLDCHARNNSAVQKLFRWGDSA
jgi:hypothetical protein